MEEFRKVPFSKVRQVNIQAFSLNYPFHVERQAGMETVHI